MSLLRFNQSDRRLYGWFLYHADPGWDLLPPDPDTRPLGPLCDNGEGRGHWIAFASEPPLWGALLRRGDTPYNDCLPPSESLLRKAFDEPAGLDEVLERIRTEAEADFYNPFNVVLGNPSEERLLYLEQSFQARSRSIDPGTHTLADEADLDEVPVDLPSPLANGLPSWDRLVEGFRSGSFDIGDALKDPPMREIATLTLFHLESDTLQMDHGVGKPDPGNMEWRSLSTSL